MNASQIQTGITYALGTVLAIWGLYQITANSNVNSGTQHLLLGLAIVNGRAELTKLTGTGK